MLWAPALPLNSGPGDDTVRLLSFTDARCDETSPVEEAESPRISSGILLTINLSLTPERCGSECFRLVAGIGVSIALVLSWSEVKDSCDILCRSCSSLNGDGRYGDTEGVTASNCELLEGNIGPCLSTPRGSMSGKRGQEANRV